ncbi:MAG: site-specific DNA-methyltransferase [Clostridiales bacterium]|jgi:DNA modification methylase|nr:site-specific DNA-methyltransferase [Clostridiales bacterium]
MIITTDALAGLKTLPDNEIDTCVTSPPYYGLRDYGVSGQIGLEDTPEEYIQKLVAVFREVRRVLKTDGTLWVNIADSYAGSLKGGGCPTIVRRNLGGGDYPRLPKPQNYKIKDLMCIPFLLAIALRADGWYLRQDIIWFKPNAVPESVKDRCTKAHEYIFLLSKSKRYYFNSNAIKEPVTESTLARMKRGRSDSHKYINDPNSQTTQNINQPRANRRGEDIELPTTRNKRSVWTIATAQCREAHFATFPPDLIRPCILAGSREGETVLDPFFGAGTTGLVAAQEGRQYIGIDINPEYCEIARKRIEESVKVKSRRVAT